MRAMKYFNGRAYFGSLRIRGHAYICARTKVEAVRLGKVAFGMAFTINELNVYWSDCWGTKAQEELGEQTESGVFLELEGKFFKMVSK